MCQIKVIYSKAMHSSTPAKFVTMRESLRTGLYYPTIDLHQVTTHIYGAYLYAEDDN